MLSGKHTTLAACDVGIAPVEVLKAPGDGNAEALGQVDDVFFGYTIPRFPENFPASFPGHFFVIEL